MSTTSIASAFAQAVLQRPEMQHGAVRLGLWIAAIAEQQGGFPVKMNMTTVREGIRTGIINAPGVSFRPETIKQSIASLEELGLLRVDTDPTASVTNHRAPKLYTLTVGDDE